MAKRNRITAELGRTIAASAPLVKTVPKQVTVDGTEVLNEIEVARLHPNPFQPRIEIEPNALSELVSSIEKNGLLQPILIAEEEGGFYILAGHRRAEAYKILGKEKITCLIKNNVTRQDMAVCAIAENAVRVDLNPVEYAISIRYLLEEGIIESQNKLAEYVGLSKGHVSKLMSVLKLPAKMIQTIKQDGYNNVYILSLLNKVAEDQIKNAYEEIKVLTRDDAESLLKQKYFKKGDVSTDQKSIFKTKHIKNKIKMEIDTAGLDKDKLEKLNKAIKKLITDFE